MRHRKQMAWLQLYPYQSLNKQSFEISTPGQCGLGLRFLNHLAPGPLPGDRRFNTVYLERHASQRFYGVVSVGPGV